MHPDAGGEIRLGLEALREGRTLAALACFEKASSGAAEDPVRASCLGYCIAKERGQRKRGIELCRAALERDPGNPIHTLNLARIHLLGRDKPAAIAVLREGMRRSPSPELVAELELLGLRRPPILPFLKRSNPLNRYLGTVLSLLGLRRG